MKKKIIIIISIIVLALLISLFIFTGRARTDVYLKDFTISEDGKTMTLEVGVSSSTGYIRKMKRTSESTNYYYTFYSTYGINSKIGAKDTFEIELDDNVDEIYFYTGNKGYELILIKRLTGYEKEWIKLDKSYDSFYNIKLTDINDIKKIGINNGKQDNNYFEYKDEDTIKGIYNIFEGLKTKVDSLTFNPENPEEYYSVEIYTEDSENAITDTSVEVYKKNDKYYAEQRYNGIYEITEEDFNVIKNLGN